MKTILLTTLGENRICLVPSQIKYWVAFNMGGKFYTRVFFVRSEPGHDYVEVMEPPGDISIQFNRCSA